MVFKRNWERKSGGKDSKAEILIWKTRIVRARRESSTNRRNFARLDENPSKKNWKNQDNPETIET